ncbi:hypothetical protein HYU09_00680 [Candidatus Woesearchaeota archaeon]|nr:hypothetical protein [Candidatus Woesearchaeota archaeon]
MIGEGKPLMATQYAPLRHAPEAATLTDYLARPIIGSNIRDIAASSYKSALRVGEQILKVGSNIATRVKETFDNLGPLQKRAISYATAGLTAVGVALYPSSAKGGHCDDSRQIVNEIKQDYNEHLSLTGIVQDPQQGNLVFQLFKSREGMVPIRESHPDYNTGEWIQTETFDGGTWTLVTKLGNKSCIQAAGVNWKDKIPESSIPNPYDKYNDPELKGKKMVAAGIVNNGTIDDGTILAILTNEDVGKSKEEKGFIAVQFLPNSGIWIKIGEGVELKKVEGPFY